MAGFEGKFSDQTQQSFNLRDLLSRSSSGTVNFGFTGNQIAMTAGIVAVAGLLFWWISRRR